MTMISWKDFANVSVFKTLHLKRNARILSEQPDGSLRTIFSNGKFDRVEPKVVFEDDFLGALDARISSTAGSGTGNAALTIVANSVNGTATLKSASDDGTNAQNGSMVTMDHLNWVASQGGLAVEVRLKVDVITAVSFMVGFTDTISTTVELPVFVNAGDIDSDATDACCIGFDTDATTDQWFIGGVKNNTDTALTLYGSAPSADTYYTIRLEVSTAGAIRGFVDGREFSSGPIANAVTASTALTPYIVVNNRGAAQRILTIDYIRVEQNRGA
jgi:hypothetical protein